MTWQWPWTETGEAGERCEGDRSHLAGGGLERLEVFCVEVEMIGGKESCGQIGDGVLLVVVE